MKHILVPTDFSPPARKALEHAVALSRQFNGKITVLHVSDAEKLSESLVGLEAFGYLSSALELPPASSGCAPSFDVDTLKQAARQKLEDWVAEFGDDNVQMETAIEQGRPAVRIVEFARENGVDTIVMGTHGRGPVAHFFLGSVAENVVRSAECPVLTVRGEPKSDDTTRTP